MSEGLKAIEGPRAYDLGEQPKASPAAGAETALARSGKFFLKAALNMADGSQSRPLNIAWAIDPGGVHHFL